MPTTCKTCGKIGRNHCAACDTKNGLCSICRHPQDTPGFKTCAKCRAISDAQAERIFARIGIRGRMAEWEVQQIERDQKFAAGLVERFKQDIANG